MKNFIEELEWRGMIHTVMPGAKEELEKGMASAYLGIDPTADSLHIGHLVGVMILNCRSSKSFRARMPSASSTTLPAIPPGLA